MSIDGTLDTFLELDNKMQQKIAERRQQVSDISVDFLDDDAGDDIETISMPTVPALRRPSRPIR